ncbi:super-infection exclusion protein B [Klebsiella variicola]
MPGWIDKLILKILGTEPVIKIMYSVFFFFIFMILTPTNVYILIESKMKVNWAWAPILYAFSFIITDLLQRVIDATWPTVKEILRITIIDYFTHKSDQDTAEKILLLSESEKDVLRVFLHKNSQTLHFPPSNIAIVKLKRKGLVIKKQEQHFGDGSEDLQIEYFITDNNWEILLLMKHNSLI